VQSRVQNPSALHRLAVGARALLLKLPSIRFPERVPGSLSNIRNVDPQMPPRHFPILMACAAALLQAASAAHYFPRYWPENSPASITIVGSGFQNPSAYAGLSVGGAACSSITALSDSEVVCTSTQMSGSGMAVSYSAGNIPPRAMVELSNQLGIQVPPFGDAWKLAFLPASAAVVLNLNCRMKDGKVIVNELSGFLECSSVDVNDWAQRSAAFKFLYTKLPSALSLNDPELAFRVSANAAAAKLTIRFLQDSSSGGAAAALKLRDMFATGQFHQAFGRIFNSMYVRFLACFFLFSR
jgi:hypothetical protein